MSLTYYNPITTLSYFNFNCRLLGNEKLCRFFAIFSFYLFTFFSNYGKYEINKNHSYSPIDSGVRKQMLYKNMMSLSDTNVVDRYLALIFKPSRTNLNLISINTNKHIFYNANLTLNHFVLYSYQKKSNGCVVFYAKCVI